MINHVNMSHINSPSLVLSDNIDIILQLRQVVKNINMNILFHHIHKPNEEEIDTATGAEIFYSKFITMPCPTFAEINSMPKADFPLIF